MVLKIKDRRACSRGGVGGEKVGGKTNLEETAGRRCKGATTFSTVKST